MKKAIVWLGILLVVGATYPIFSASDFNPKYLEISMMLDNTKKLSDVQISLISQQVSNLSIEQKFMLYESHKKSATLPFVINFFVGAGIGSYVQGDTKGGTVGLVLDLLAMSFVSNGFLLAYNRSLNDGGNYDTSPEISVLAGSALLLASKIYQGIRPFKFVKEENRKLARSLDVNFAMVPTLDDQGDFQMKVATAFSF